MRFNAEARIVRVVDGDTFHSFLDIGWGIILSPRLGKRPGGGTVRLLYADGSPWDSPEKKDEARSDRATMALMSLLRVGELYPVVSHRLDAFGRTLGSVQLPDGRDVAAVLAEQGHAK